MPGQRLRSIPKRKKTGFHSRLSCKIEYFEKSDQTGLQIASGFFTDDDMKPPSPRGRLLYVDRLRRVRWRKRQP